MKKNKTYKLRIKVGNRLLNFTALIVDIDSNFVTFKDKFNEIISYNLNTIVEYKEVEE